MVSSLLFTNVYASRNPLCLFIPSSAFLFLPSGCRFDGFFATVTRGTTHCSQRGGFPHSHQGWHESARGKRPPRCLLLLRRALVFGIFDGPSPFSLCFLCLFEVQGDQGVAFSKPDQLILGARRFGDLHLNDFHDFITKR